MNMREHVENEVKTIKETYLIDKKRIKHDYHGEIDYQESYHGRELLELLQNADDEMRNASNPKVQIRFDGVGLTVSNNGRAFSKDGVSALMVSNISPKRSQREYIGNMGTGFRSILGWAEEIIIHSDDLHIKFSYDHAQHELEKVYPRCKEEGLISATLVFPEWIESYNPQEFTTEITIKTSGNKKVREDIVGQINKLNGEILLFLNNTKELELIVDDTTRTFKKKNKDRSIVIEEYKNTELVDSKEWLVKRSEDNRFEDKYYSITLAYDISGNPPVHQVLYAYFPTKVEFPFNVLLNADFDVNNDRNGLKICDANKAIFKSAAKLLVELALDIYNGEVSYNPLQFLITEEIPLVLRDDFEFDVCLKEAICNAKIFPTIKGDYSEFKDGLKYYYGHLAEYVSGETFNNLMPYCDGAEVDDYIRDLFEDYEYDSHYEDQELTEGVNEWVTSLPETDESLQKIVSCLSALNSDKDCRLLHYNDSLNLKLEILIDKEFNVIPFGEPVFIRNEESIAIDPPSYMTVRFLHPVMDELIRNDENLTQVLSSFNIHFFDFEDMVETSNNIILQENNLDYCREELNWLWNNQHLLDEHKVQIVLPNRNHDLMKTGDMYIGKEYKNEAEERIISSFNTTDFVVDIKETLSITNSEAKTFLSKVGTLRFPQIYSKTIHCYEWGDKSEKYHSFIRKEYTDALLSGFAYPLSKDGHTFKTSNELKRKFYSLSVSVSDIDNLEDVLSEASTEDIIYWIRHDEMLRKILYEKYEPSVNTVNIQWYGDYNRALGVKTINVKVLSPISWLFSAIPWIMVEGEKYKISDCLLGLDENIDLSPCLVRPAIDNYISELSGKQKKNRSEYTSIFISLGVQEHFSDLSVEKIYETLNYISDVEGSGSVAKRFYNELLEDDSRKRILEYLKNNKVDQYNDFIANGRVFCLNGKYVDVKKASYVSKKGICNSLLESLDLLAVSGRVAYSAIPPLFGVKELKIKGLSLFNYSLNSNYKLFEEDFKRYKSLAFTYRVNSKKDFRSQARKFINLNVILCSNVAVKYNDKIYNLSDGDFYYELPNTFYLCSPTPFRMDNKDIKLSIGIANIVCSHLDITDNKSEFQGLYAANNTGDRMMILSESFDIETINRAKKLINTDEDASDVFIKTIDKLTDKDIKECQKLIDDIDFDNFYSEFNFDTIIKLFRKLDIDVEDFNSKSDYNLDLIPYYRKKTEGMLPDYRSYYKTTKFHNYKNSSIEDKKNLQSEFIRFETIQNDITYRNSVFYDCKKEIVKQLSINVNLDPIDFNSLYSDNKVIFKSKITDLNYIDDFLSLTSNASLLYYGEYEILTELYNEYVASIEPDPDEQEIPESSNIKPVEFVSMKTKPHELQTNSTPAEKKQRKATTTGFKSNEKITSKYGRDGERYVYYELLKDEKKRNVVWKSENGQKEGVYPEGSNKYGYDLEYVNENGELCIVEVKSTTAPLSAGVRFSLPASEYSVGQKNSGRYYIYYVTEIKSNPKIFVIDNLFINGEFNYEAFSKVPESYMVMADEDA